MLKALLAALFTVGGGALLLVGSVDDLWSFVGIFPLALGIFLYGQITVADYKSSQEDKQATQNK